MKKLLILMFFIHLKLWASDLALAPISVAELTKILLSSVNFQFQALNLTIIAKEPKKEKNYLKFFLEEDFIKIKNINIPLKVVLIGQGQKIPKNSNCLLLTPEARPVNSRILTFATTKEQVLKGAHFGIILNKKQKPTILLNLQKMLEHGFSVDSSILSLVEVVSKQIKEEK